MVLFSARQFELQTKIPHPETSTHIYKYKYIYILATVTGALPSDAHFFFSTSVVWCNQTFFFFFGNVDSLTEDIGSKTSCKLAFCFGHWACQSSLQVLSCAAWLHPPVPRLCCCGRRPDQMWHFLTRSAGKDHMKSCILFMDHLQYCAILFNALKEKGSNLSEASLQLHPIS